MEIYMPVQNEFSSEFYIICSNYKKILSNEEFQILFSLLSDKKLSISVIEKYDDTFMHEFEKILDVLFSNYRQSVDKRLYYIDFWNYIVHIDKEKINESVDTKYNHWIDYYILRK